MSKHKRHGDSAGNGANRMTTYKPSDGVVPSQNAIAEWLYDRYGWPIEEARDYARLIAAVRIKAKGAKS